MENVINKLRPGRKPAIISWPEGEFTIKEVKDSSGRSGGCILKKVNEAIVIGTLRTSGKRPNGKGKPATLYCKTSSNGTNSENESSEATQA